MFFLKTSHTSLSKLVFIFLFLNTAFSQDRDPSAALSEYVEWVGSCETDAIEKAQLEGLGSLSLKEKVQYYFDSRRCKYRNEAKRVHRRIDDKQLKEDAVNSASLAGKSSSLSVCVIVTIIFLSLPEYDGLNIFKGKSK